MSALDISYLHYSQAQKFYDKHTLYLDTGAINLQTLEQIIEKAIRNTVKSLKAEGIQIDPSYKLNLVCNKQNESLGYAYMWVNDEKLYNICNGKNADGSDRIIEVPDPRYSQITPSATSTASTDLVSPANKSNRWEDLEDDETDIPLIKQQLESLINFDRYTYTQSDMQNLERIYTYSMNKKAFKLFSENVKFSTDDQNEIWRKYEAFIDVNLRYDYKKIEIYLFIISVLNNPENDGIEEENFYDLVNESMKQNEELDVKLPEYIDINISGSYVNNVEEDEIRNSLSAKIMSQNYPSAEEIRKYFEPYSTSPIKGKFPKVEIIKNPRGGAYVNVLFDDRAGRDAQFALYMTKKLYFPSFNCLLLFSITKRPVRNTNNNNNKNYANNNNKNYTNKRY